jgi:hypothetical protein
MPKLVGSVVESAADTYTQAEIQTGLLGQVRRAARIAGIQFQLSSGFSSAAASQTLAFGLQRQSKTAEPNIDDQSVVWKEKYFTTIATSVGQVIQPDLNGIWVPPLDILIVEDPVYIWIRGVATTMQHTLRVGVIYEVVELSEVERLALLAESLSSLA